MKKTFEEITETSVNTKGMTKKQTALFHYFNPHGLVSRKKLLDTRVSDAVDKNKVPSGWIFAYGSFNTYYYDRIREIATGKEKVTKTLLAVIISNFYDELNKIEEKLKEIGE